MSRRPAPTPRPSIRTPSPLLLLLVACGGDRGTEAPSPTDADAVVDPLSAEQQLVRVSMALRGTRPAVGELDTVADDPGAVDDLVDAWLDSDAFGATVADLHAELFLIRDDTNYQLPVKGVLENAGYNQADVHHSTVEAPLELVRQVVMGDRPYTEILTGDYAMADEVVADVYGLPYDPDGPKWQQTRWVDGRPHAGVLSDSQMWRRHTSNAANFHRGRANFVSRTFLCEDIGGRDIFVAGGVDIADEFAVAEAVSTNPGCVGCHNVLDPLAAFFWGYKEQLQRGAINQAYNFDCEWDWTQGDPPRGDYRVEHWCYPLKFYDVAEEGAWEDWRLRAPGYFGQPAGDMADLGHMISDDPRFATCTARNFASYLMQTDRDAIPHTLAAEWGDVLVDSGFDAKELARAIVLSDAFTGARVVEGDAFLAGLQTVRPEQLDRAVADLTGFTWLADQDFPGCSSPVNVCWDTVNLMTSDLYGFRSMAGGVDSYTVTHPIHGPTPTRALTLAKLASEAGGYVVTEDFAVPAGERRLLTEVEPDTVDEAMVRAQLAVLHLRILGERVGPDSSAVDLSWSLWDGARERHGDPVPAWALVVSALLQDPRMVFY